jgi:ribose transport system ATP-binding protein
VSDRPLLQMSDIVKQFPGVRALDGVDLDVRRGEVHCLLGQNGAGKSTLIKVLSGAHQPDAGTIAWAGEQVRFDRPLDALHAGLATIYQELDLVDGLTVADNIYLGHEQTQAGFVSRQAMHRSAGRILEQLGHPEISPRREVGTLSAAGKQIVSMARALSHEARLIIMDEPSAVLDADEVDNLFRVIRELQRDGVAIVYISHRLDEIREIGDRVTILKDGRTVATGIDARGTPTREITELMTGRDIEYVFPDRRQPVGADAPEVLRIEHLSRPGEVHDVSFSVHAGEIVGLAGLVGSGRSEILETIYGARKPSRGRVLVDGRPLRSGSIPAAVRAGVGLAPEERKSQALLLSEPVFKNVSLSSFPRYARAGFLTGDVELDDTERSIRTLDVRPADGRRAANTLSGGNQQKVVVARWLLKRCRVLLLDEPTRGVDVGARSELYRVIRGLADDGVAIVMVSSEVPEVLGLADRVLVVKDGGVVHEAAATQIDEAQVLDLVMQGDVA